MLETLMFASLMVSGVPAEFPLPDGKAKTDRSIVMSTILDAPREQVLKMWLDAEATKEFFGAWARIEGKVGGSYEIYFMPPGHPEGDANSSKGARLLYLESPGMLAFEWTAPPFAAHLNQIAPLPTWVEITLKPLEGRPGHTHLQLAHHGFGRGQGWDETYEFFVRGWAQILFRLDRHLVMTDNRP